MINDVSHHRKINSFFETYLEKNSAGKSIHIKFLVYIRFKFCKLLILMKKIILTLFSKSFVTSSVNAS